MRMPEKISVLLVDDHNLVRRGFRRILEDEPDIVVAGEAGDGAEAIQLADELRPKVIVMDCAMPGMNGAAAGQIIAARWPALAILYITGHADPVALEAGFAEGHVLKNPFVAADLDAKIRFVMDRRDPGRASNVVPLRTHAS